MENLPEVLVVGVGSDHGDDQVGWRVVESLWLHPHFAGRAIAVSELTRLIYQLDGCTQLVIVDACQSGAPVGTITRLAWPDCRIELQHGRSSHGIGVCEALRLAEQLGLLPERVVLLGVEVKSCEPGDELSPAVRRAVDVLVSQVVEDVTELQYA